MSKHNHLAVPDGRFMIQHCILNQLVNRFGKETVEKSLFSLDDHFNGIGVDMIHVNGAQRAGVSFSGDYKFEVERGLAAFYQTMNVDQKNFIDKHEVGTEIVWLISSEPVLNFLSIESTVQSLFTFHHDTLPPGSIFEMARFQFKNKEEVRKALGKHGYATSSKFTRKQLNKMYDHKILGAPETVSVGLMNYQNVLCMTTKDPILFDALDILVEYGKEDKVRVYHGNNPFSNTVTFYIDN